MRIDCDRCPRRVGDAPCEGCLVSFVLALEDGSSPFEREDADEGGAAVVSASEARAVRALADAGLVGPVRIRPAGDAG